MLKQSFVLLIGLLSWRAPLLAGQGHAAPSDSARLQGTWVMVSGAASGTPFPVEYVRSTRRVASGNEVTVTTLGGEVFFKATIVLNPAANPKTIDYHMIGGPTANNVQLGIYILAGDTLRSCFASPGKARPTDFTTVAGDGRTLSTWLPAKP